MEIIYVLIPIAMIFVVLGIMAFFWAVKTDQYTDLDKEAINILFDEDTPRPRKNNNIPKENKEETNDK